MPEEGGLQVVDWDELESSRDEGALRKALLARERGRLRGSRRSLSDVRRLGELARLILAEMEERGEISFLLDEMGAIRAVYIGSRPSGRSER